MRQLPLFVLLSVLAIGSLACSSTVANNGPNGTGSGDTGTGDTGTGPDGTAADGNDTTGEPGTDAIAVDVDSWGSDAASGTDVSGTDAVETPDTDTVDAEMTDIADAADDVDIAPDVSTTDGDFTDVPDVLPGSCTKDADCLGLNFAPCQIGFCDGSSKMCKVKPVADGAACAIGGACGGPGTCKKGGCDAPTTCIPDVCSPQELACGSKITIDLASLGASKFSGYGGCDSNKWAGPEAAVLLTADVTMTATLNLDTTGVTADTQLFDVAPTLDGKCDAAACDTASYYSLTIGLPAGVPRIVILDTSAADTGVVTLTLDCTIVTQCGDGTCGANETCANCAKDCGMCADPGCGNGTCDPSENCITCEQDCKQCVAGCMASPAPSCNGCGCEACVCGQDPLCCSSSWDDICVGECGSCGATCPPFNDVCGDGVCGASEYSSSCPNDCGGYLYCGDGVCSASEKEDCKGCAQDCGFCLTTGLASSGCGDGTCTGDENCTTCTADCGVCGDYSCACLTDASCCTGDFGYYCQDACNTCIANNGGGSCPKSNCGDGVCSGETCLSCSSDCGKCPAFCGDNNCDPGEDKANCPADCSFGCQGKCGQSTASKEADGTFCYCDSLCADPTYGDCCSDKATYCP